MSGENKNHALTLMKYLYFFQQQMHRTTTPTVSRITTILVQVAERAAEHRGHLCICTVRDSDDDDTLFY